jgi:hypothetical protein
MCLMCQEEDLYFLYLERIEREKKAARGETSPPDAGWLWRTPGPAQPSRAADATGAEPPADTRFTCDMPERE